MTKRHLFLCTMWTFTILFSAIPSWADELPPPGAKGYGLTVFQGFEIEKFSITVLGKAPRNLRGADMLLIRIDDGPLPGFQSGILSGMSGSPIYVDGRLVGALSYGYLGGKIPIGGVTLIEKMFEPALAPLAATGGACVLSEPLALGDRTFRRVQIGETADQSADTLALQPLSSPLVVEGMDSQSAEFLSQVLPQFTLIRTDNPEPRGVQAPIRFPSSPELQAQAIQVARPPSPSPLDPPELEPGSAFAIQLMRGDLAIFATGTVTWREGNEILGLGHAFTEMGPVNFPFSPAYVSTIHPSYLSGTKMSSYLDPIGTITRDFYFGVAGQIGRPTKLTPVKLDVGQKTFQLEIVEHPAVTSSLLAAAVSTACASLVDRGDTYRLNLKGQMSFEGISTAVPVHLSSTGPDAPSLLARNLLDRMEKVTDPKAERAHLTQANLQVSVERAEVLRISRLVTDKHKYSSGETAIVDVFMQHTDGHTSSRRFSCPLPEVESKSQIKISASAPPSRGLEESFDLTIPKPSTLEERLHLYLAEGRDDDSLYLYRSGDYKSLPVPLVGGWPFYSAPASWNASLVGFASVKDVWTARSSTGALVEGALSTEIEILPNEKAKSERLLKGYDKEIKPRPTLADLGNETFRWQLFEDAHWQKGELRGVTISKGVRKAPVPERVDGVPGQVVTSLLSTGPGLYSGWTGGQVRLLNAGGTSTILDTGSAAVTALAERGGRLVCGLSTPGKILDGGQGWRLPVAYVWALGQHEGTLYAGCGRPATLYRVGGEPQPLWTAPDEHITGLRSTEEGMYITTAPRGLVYRLEAGSDPVLVDKVGRAVFDYSDGSLASAGGLVTGDRLDKAPGGLLAVTPKWAGGAGGLFARHSDHLALISHLPVRSLASHRGETFVGSDGLYKMVETSQPALYSSPVFNAGDTSTFSNLRWTGSPKLKVRGRGGDTPTPDLTWQDWSKPLDDPLGSSPGLRACQYFQFQVEVGTGCLESLEVTYRSSTQDGPIRFQSLAGERFRDILSVKWSGQEPAEKVELFLERDGQWVSVQEPAEPGLLVMSTDSLPEGPSKLRLVSKAGAHVSPQFFILKAKPEIKLLSDTRGLVTTSKYGQVVKVEYKLGKGDWRPALPVDGAFDSWQEQFSFGYLPGQLLEIRAFDESDAEATQKREPAQPSGASGE